jgi:hypothetical protein
VYLLLSRPAVDEETDRNYEGTRHHEWKPVFRLWFSAVALRHCSDDSVRDEAHYKDAYKGAYARAEIDRADGLLGEAVVTFEDARVGRKEEV